MADTGTWATGTRWAVKNLFELKLGQRVRVHGNLMEHAWQESQTGFAVLLTPRNQDATSPWIAVRDVTFTGNLVRHAGSGVQIEGYDTNATSGQTRRITIAQNIFDDISASAWGGSGRWIQIGNRPSDLTIDHNTVLHDGQAIYVYGGSYGAEMTVANLRFTNNLLKHNTYGIMGNARAYGTDTLTVYFPGALVQRNTFAGGSAARYPAGNEFPTVAFWQGQFVDVTASNFALIASSSYRASGTDALDLGAPVAQVEADALTARQGRTGAPPPVVIGTTTLPAGQTGAAYAATLQATGGSGTYGWRVTAGALPAGLSLAAATGVLRGTPGQSGTFPITVQAQDAADPANVAGQAYALRIASTPPAVSLASPIPGATLVGPTAALVAAATDADGTVTRVDFYANATILGSASAAPWSITWDPVAPGTYRLTAVATDNDGLTTTSAAADVTVVAPVSIATVSVPQGQTGTPYAVTLSATGGTGAYTWSVAAGGLPGGVSLGTSSGLIAGTPSQSGTSTFTVRAQDPSDPTNAATRSYTLTIGSPPMVAPMVAITTPVTGATITSASIGIAATASDADGTVAHVTFLINGVVVGDDRTSPWGATWDATTPGTYTLMARAYDNVGNVGTSLPVSITVQTSPKRGEDVVLWAAEAAVVSGWALTPEPAAAAGARLEIPDLGAAKLAAPLASPTQYFDLTFYAIKGRGYRLWVRGKAQGNAYVNDSAFIQFDHSVDPTGAAVYRIGSTSATVYSVEDCSGCGLAGWGWSDNGYGMNGALIYFDSTGPQRVRVQKREDGLGIDQIVLSSRQWLTQAPGSTKNDTVVLAKTDTQQTPNQPPTVAITQPASGTTVGVPSPLTIVASAADPDGTDTRVEFVVNSTVVTNLTAASWEAAHSFLSPGTYTWTARTYDNAGAVKSVVVRVRRNPQ